MNFNNPFTPLPLEDWEESKITLHLWMQIVGKIKLDLVPRKNHWWHITLFASPKGITSGTIPDHRGSFQVDFNFQSHKLELITSWGRYEYFDLKDGLSVKEFHRNFFEILYKLEIPAKITPVPYDHPCKEPFAECETHRSYNMEFVGRFWQILIAVDNVFKEFSGKFYGKVSPSQIYWHHMDLAVTRFSGKPGPGLEEGSTEADKDAYSHEVISAGFWAGDENVRGAAFYAYAYPSPENIESQKLFPSSAKWDLSSGSPMAILMYDDLIQLENPKAELMNFLQSTYNAGASLAGWPDELNYEH